MTTTHFLQRCFLILILSFDSLALADKAAPSFPAVDSEPLGAVSAGALVLHDNWQMREEAIVGDHGDTFSSPTFEATGWYPATVPTTALATLVRNGIYPDPIMGTNMMRIPDVNEAENTRYNLMQYSHLPDHSNPFDRPYWFRTSFTLPASYHGQVVWLHLDGINYRADVWLNGHQIANAKDVVGMFKRFRFDISKFAKAGETNTLAIRIHPLDVPGDPVEEQLGGVYGAVRAQRRRPNNSCQCHHVPNASAGIGRQACVIGTWGSGSMSGWKQLARWPCAILPGSWISNWTPGQDAPIKVRGYMDNPGPQAGEHRSYRPH